MLDFKQDGASEHTRRHTTDVLMEEGLIERDWTPRFSDIPAQRTVEGFFLELCTTAVVNSALSINMTRQGKLTCVVKRVSKPMLTERNKLQRERVAIYLYLTSAHILSGRCTL